MNKPDTYTPDTELQRQVTEAVRNAARLSKWRAKQTAQHQTAQPPHDHR